MERKTTKILDWLIDECGIDSDCAKDVAKELSWFSSIENFQIAVVEDPSLMDLINTSELNKKFLKTKIFSYNHNHAHSNHAATDETKPLSNKLKIPDYGAVESGSVKVYNTGPNTSPHKPSLDVPVLSSSSATIENVPVSISSVDNIFKSDNTTSSTSSFSSRPMRAARLLKPDFFVAEPAICTIKPKKARPIEEGEDTGKGQAKRQRYPYKDDVESTLQGQRRSGDFKRIIREQAEIVASPHLDLQLRYAAIGSFFEIIQEEPDTINFIKDTEVYQHILEILRNSMSVDDKVIYRSMKILYVAITCIDSAARYLVEAGVVQVVLPLCSSNCTRVRLEALRVINNIGASEYKGAVVTLEVVQAIAQSYASSESLVPIETDSVAHRYGRVLETLTACCSRDQAHMMIPFIPVLKNLLPIVTSVKDVRIACSVLANLLSSQEVTVVDAIFENKMVSILLQKLENSKITITWISLNLFVNIADSCNCQQVLQLQSAVQPLYQIILKICQGYNHEKEVALAMECISSISQRGAIAVSMVMRCTPTLYKTLVALINEDLVFAKQSRAQYDSIFRSAVSTLMCGLSNAAGDDLAHFMNIGCYPLCFALLEEIRDDELVQDVLGGLSHMVNDLPNIEHLQQENFDAAGAWALVRNMATGRRRDWVNRNTSALLLKNIEDAQKLHNAAIQLGLTEA